MNENLETVGERAFYRCLSLQGFKFPNISIRLENIIEAGQTEMESKVEEAIIGNACSIVWRKGEEMFVPAESLRAEHPRTSTNRDFIISSTIWWSSIKQRMDKIMKHLSYHEMKEATTMFELALWKARIDQVADDAYDINRDACRIEVPGPVKDIILKYI